ncbi:MAG TPA: hypothetical protein VF736_13730 [Pyrinomonadaceae bacterium]|jgi:hypothetical protein
MPRRNTFAAARFRGPVQFDSDLIKRGLPVAAFKLYAALLTQDSNNAPVASVVSNSIGGEVIWTREAQGNYFGTLAGGFPAGKTLCFIGTSEEPMFYNGIRRGGGDVVQIQTWILNTDDPGAIQWVEVDNRLQETQVFILIFN